MSVSAVSVTVPATTANIGPGFDCLGAALTLYNQFEFALLKPERGESPCHIHVKGMEAQRVKTDRSNLAYQAFSHLFQHLGRSLPPVQIKIQLGVPLARGLGSSATAIVAGLLGANYLAGLPLDQTEILKLAIAMEGHPDNVAPALMGGCLLAATGQDPATWAICDLPWASDVVPTVAIPNFELSTQAARQVLPKQCSYADAIFNTAHLGLLIRGLESGRADWLAAALQDQLHQPYRQDLIQGYPAVYAAALAAGAYGLVISGAGPTLLALSPAAKAEAVATQMQRAWAEAEITAQVESLQIDTQGAIAIALDQA